MDVMSIAALSMHMSKANLMNDISIKVMDNALEHAQDTGMQIADLMATIQVPNVDFSAGSFDVSL